MLDARVLGGAACVAAMFLTTVPVAAKPTTKGGAATPKALGEALVAALQARDGVALRALAPSGDQLRGLCTGDPESVVHAVDALLELDPGSVAAIDGVAIAAERIDVPSSENRWATIAAGAAWRSESGGWAADACTLARPIQGANLYLHLLDRLGKITKQSPVRLPVIRIDGRVYAMPFRPLAPQIAQGAAPLIVAAARFERCQSLAKHLVDLGALDEMPADGELKGLCDTVDNATADCAMAAKTKEVVDRCATELATAEQCTAMFARQDALGGEAVAADRRATELASCPENTQAATARCLAAATTLEAFRACTAPL